MLLKQSPWLLGTILDGSPLRHRIPACWHSFCRARKDNRQSQPHLVLIQQLSGISTQDPRIQSPPPLTIKPTPGIQVPVKGHSICGAAAPKQDDCNPTAKQPYARIRRSTEWKYLKVRVCSTFFLVLIHSMTFTMKGSMRSTRFWTHKSEMYFLESISTKTSGLIIW